MQVSTREVGMCSRMTSATEIFTDATSARFLAPGDSALSNSVLIASLSQ